VTSEFPDVIWVLVFFNLGDAIFQGRKGMSEDSDCLYLGVCWVARVKDAGCHIGLELLTAIKVGSTCDPGTKEPAP